MRILLLVLFAISGFTGLIYESIWAHYLKLFLGHASYAQALVLMIFMGGMALGAWFAGHRVNKWNNLLMMYAVIEAVIGIFGLLFHPVFNHIVNTSHEFIIPMIDYPLGINLYKWFISALLILPQSILLGMTFPLMSNGIIRRFSNLPGNTISVLYFSNSIGAAIGVLVSGFYLIKLFGLPGTIMTAGILNIFLALSVFLIIKEKTENKEAIQTTLSSFRIPVLMLTAAFITGMASFIYEITWIRMLNMVLGSSTHAFELMLSAFITGIALGSFWIRKRIDQINNLVQTSGYIQILMGFMALATLPLYNYTFNLMEFFMTALQRTDQGYILFTFTEHLIALLVMLPTTFFAGMTLPLFSFILLKQGYGERSIGQIYSSNTLGAISGVLFAVFVGMPILGLKGSLLTGCVLDILLGIILLVTTSTRYQSRKMVLIPSISLILILTISFGTSFDNRKMSSGIFRTGIQYYDKNMKSIYYQDGRTASISINIINGIKTITTNGKSDASINMSDQEGTTLDEGTMVLLGSLPLFINPNAKTVANIGMGSGLTTHTVLSWPGVQSVETIEIEPKIIEGAKYFMPRVDKAFNDPRSQIYIADAKTYFSTHQKQYDVIISEPSNPWVSGVASLFTDEFYKRIGNHLTPDGIFVQWLQLYEINENLIISILKALSRNFHDFKIFSSVDFDLIIVASENNIVPEPDEVIFSSSELKKELEIINVKNIQDIYARYMGNKELYLPLLKESNIPINSDFFPIVDLGATRAMYLSESVTNFINLKLAPVPVLSALVKPKLQFHNTDITSTPHYIYSLKVKDAKEIYKYLTDTSYEVNSVFMKYGLLKDYDKSCSMKYTSTWYDVFLQLVISTIPYLQPNEIQNISSAIKLECISNNDSLQDKWLNLYLALGQQDADSIAENANILMQNSNQWSIEHLQFLFSANLLGLIAMNEFHLAVLFWHINIDKLFVDQIPFQLKVMYSIAKSRI